MEEKLLALTWNSFKRYPDQGMDIVLHLVGAEDGIHKFVKVRGFNASLFNPQSIYDTLPKRSWYVTWLPERLVMAALGKGSEG